ncbi:MAG: hypothetical protein WBA93_34160 [Microcoleaceae cyanobacterium]
MKKIYEKLAVAGTGVVLSFGSLTMGIPAQAASMTYDFSVTNIEGGIHDGSTGSGSFTFDNEGVGVPGEMVKQVSVFEFTWLGETYGVETLDFENDADGVLFVDGVFQGLDWDYNIGPLSWDLLTDSFIYTDSSALNFQFEGEGQVSYQKQEPVSDVPEPGVVLGLALISVAGLLNKNKLSHR